jgi:short-subunit dehydrogenase
MAVMAITGGTAGVGKATALRFARAGYDVGIIARDGRSLEATKQELLRCGVRVHTVQADVANADALLTRPPAKSKIGSGLSRSGSITRCVRCWRLSER